MRILIVCNSSPPRFVGGAELMAHEQAKALARLGHEVAVFAGDLGAPYSRHARTDDLYDGICYHRVATTPQDYSPEYLNFTHSLVEAHFSNVVQSLAPDIVHCHNLIGLSVKLPMLARRYGAAVVCTLHDFWGFCLRNTAMRPDGTSCADLTQCTLCLPRIHDGRHLHVPMRFRKDFMRLALASVDRYIAPSQFVADAYAQAGFAADRLMVLRNGINTAHFRPVDQSHASNRVRITYAGYLGAHKGVATLLAALPLTTPHRAIIQLVGAGPEEAAYRADAERLGIADRVHFLGKVMPAEMPAIYVRSDVVVLPSIWPENQPVCLMEAMASGLPVVASREGGIPELVEHGGNGLLFTAGDAVDLASQLAALCAEPALRRRLGLEGRRRVEHLDHASQAVRLTTVYEELNARPRSAGTGLRVFAALGALDAPNIDHAPAPAGQSSSCHVPPDWVADTVDFAGVVLPDKIGRLLRPARLPKAFSFPPGLRRAGSALVRLLGTKARS